MIILVFFTHFLLSIIFPVGRLAVTVSSPIFFTGVRMTLAGIILLGFQLSKGKLVLLKKEYVVPIILFTVFGIYLTNVPEFWALKFLPAAKASFIYSLSPFVSALLSYICFNERMNLQKVLGMGIGLIGFLWMLSYDAPGEIALCPIGLFSWGEIAMITAAIATAYGWIVARPLIRAKNCSPVEFVGLGMLVGGIVSLLNSYMVEVWNPLPIFTYSTFFICLAFAVLCSSVLGYVLYVYLLQFYTTTFLSFAGFVEPFFAAITSWFLNGEYVTWRFFGCSILVFIGLSIFYQSELKQGYILKS